MPPVVNRNPNPPPRRVPNAMLRSREYLTEDEVSDLISAAGRVGRNRLRDATLILVSYRHGLRVSEAADLRYVFVSELKGPLTPAAIQHIVARAGQLAGMPFRVHPHMLRHACGYKLANDGQDTRAIQAYLGHRNINHTVRYTELSPERFRGFWED
jgi:type 1 fimbriae regulatory protein FimB/type 1 fimbriae regulatory protein FimE